MNICIKFHFHVTRRAATSLSDIGLTLAEIAGRSICKYGLASAVISILCYSELPKSCGSTALTNQYMTVGGKPAEHVGASNNVLAV